ncbi:uncharacterized protein N7496_000168 [Penicillium cataractarum]|uniref:Uncharacterized protein n=1 Tax=Penicillium cataractarum TaxID=2100454 RepID=A0A9W9VTS9_9EURO|nr:uncharacterized protein N7496_000168 [Penicillium cataractarum]KAJ5389100.1 hypothetical protein N7496_000168 [Penicillium cataractarum]
MQSHLPSVDHAPWQYSHSMPEHQWLAASTIATRSMSNELLIPRERPPKSLPQIIASRFQFAIDVLKNTPKIMVLENQTPWCHRYLYKDHMPKSIKDAYTCCSLYMSKNEIYAALIMSLIDDRMRDVLLLPEPNSDLEILTLNHSLILFQIMRLFDGDICSQATEDQTLATLESSAYLLLQRLESWVLQESARKTVLCAFYFIKIFKLLRGKAKCTVTYTLFGEHAFYSRPIYGRLKTCLTSLMFIRKENTSSFIILRFPLLYKMLSLAISICSEKCF